MKQLGKIRWNFPGGVTSTQRERELIWAASDAVIETRPRFGQAYEKGEALPIAIRRYIEFSHYRQNINRTVFTRGL